MAAEETLVRPARAGDAAVIAKVHVDTWRTAYKGLMPDDYIASHTLEKREAMWRGILAARVETVLLAESVKGEVVAFVGGGEARGDHAGYRGELYGLYVLEAWRRREIGRQLVRALTERLMRQGFENMLLWALEKNPATAFYERLGGKVVARRTINVGEVSLDEVAYGWDDLRPLAT